MKNKPIHINTGLSSSWYLAEYIEIGLITLGSFYYQRVIFWNSGNTVKQQKIWEYTEKYWNFILLKTLCSLEHILVTYTQPCRGRNSSVGGQVPGGKSESQNIISAWVDYKKPHWTNLHVTAVLQTLLTPQSTANWGENGLFHVAQCHLCDRSRTVRASHTFCWFGEILLHLTGEAGRPCTRSFLYFSRVWISLSHFCWSLSVHANMKIQSIPVKSRIRL